MSYTLNRKLADLKAYDPIQGEYRIRMDANESFIDINPQLSKKITDAVSGVALNRYPDPYAAGPIQAFSDLYTVPPQYVTAGNGSDELISVITGCFLEKGDKILTLSPDFSMYAFYGSLFELEVQTFEKSTDLSIDVDCVIEVCNRENVKALIFSNPCNPTSLGLTRKEVIRLISSVSCLVILDEAYMDFWSESLLDRIAEFDHLIILKTCSKAMGLAALRLGFAVAGETITNALKAAKSPYNTDSISQAVGACILREKELLAQNRKRIIESRDELYRGISLSASKYPALEAVFEPKTNFVLIQTAYANEIYRKLLQNSIAVRCLGNYLRITAGSTQENQEFLLKLETVLQTF